MGVDIGVDRRYVVLEVIMTSSCSLSIKNFSRPLNQKERALLACLCYI